VRGGPSDRDWSRSPGAASPAQRSATRDVEEPSDRRFVADAVLRFGVPASRIKALIRTENRGAVFAVSPKASMDLMQFMPRTWSLALALRLRRQSF
jgi:soluble lytic murein transglycosylase-like protein